jgi:dimethylargininase
VGVPVPGCLHLKSAVTALDEHTLLANRAWFDSSFFHGYDWLDVDPTEASRRQRTYSLRHRYFSGFLPAHLCAYRSSRLHRRQARHSELQKAESGLTCSSLLFDAADRFTARSSNRATNRAALFFYR